MSSKKARIKIATERPKLVEGKEQIVDVLIRIDPPEVEKEESQRPRLNLSLVVDRSGSMAGAKMEHAKLAVMHCIDNLLPSDRFSVVMFDNVVETLIESTRAEHPSLYKEIIRGIYAGATTALHEGWIKGGLQVSEFQDGGAINRVILVTDGLANVGETNPDRIVSQAAGLAEKGISTTTIGIGRDFAEDLLIPMAESADGNAWHVERPEDLVKMFEVELQGALKSVGKEARLRIDAEDGVEVVECLNSFALRGGEYRLPDLTAGSPLDIVLKVKVPASNSKRPKKLFSATLEYVDQVSGRTARIQGVFRAGFDTEEAVEKLEKNYRVRDAILVLEHAKIRERAIHEVDCDNRIGALNLFSDWAAKLESVGEEHMSPTLADEISEAAMHIGDLNIRGDDPLTRKKMSYLAMQSRHNKKRWNK